jgi:transposase
MNTANHDRHPYPTNITDAEWDFVAPYLTLMTEDAPQREHDLREVCNGVRWMVRAGASWHTLPRDCPRREAVYQQTQRCIKTGCFEAITDDLRLVLHLA